MHMATVQECRFTIALSPAPMHKCDDHPPRPQVPPPWSRVPGFLLRNAAGTILSAVMQNVIAAFADLLARDYRRCGHGPTAPTQSLHSMIYTIHALCHHFRDTCDALGCQETGNLLGSSAFEL